MEEGLNSHSRRTDRAQKETDLYGKQEIPAADRARRVLWPSHLNKPKPQQSLQISPKAADVNKKQPSQNVFYLMR